MTPVLGLQVRAAARKGAKIVSLDPVAGLDNHNPLRIVPELFADNLVLEALVAALLEGASLSGELPHLEAAMKTAARLTISEAAGKAGVAEADLLEAVAALRKSESLAVLVGKDIVQRADGHRGLFFLGCLSYLKNGRILLLADRPNEQGVIDMGCLPDTLPGGRPLSLEAFRTRYAEAARITVPDGEGITLLEMIAEAESPG